MDYLQKLTQMLKNNNMEKSYNNLIQVLALSRDELLSFSFKKINIPAGSIIEFVEDNNIKAIVNGNKTVAFENKTWHLSQLVRELKTRNGTNTNSGAYQGSCYFTFNGEKLFDIWQKSIGRQPI